MEVVVFLGSFIKNRECSYEFKLSVTTFFLPMSKHIEQSKGNREVEVEEMEEKRTYISFSVVGKIVTQSGKH